MSGRFNEVFDDHVRDLVGALLDERLPPAISREMQKVERAETDEMRQLRLISVKEFLTKTEAALFFGVSEGHIDNLIADDPDFPATKIGKLTRCRRVDLIEWARKQARRGARPQSVAA